MPTAQDMIYESLRLMAVYAPNETPTDADVEQGLTCLNDMLDSWSNESLSCFAILEQSGTVVAGKSSYTIGPSGDFNLTRPLRLIEGPGAAYSQDTQNRVKAFQTAHGLETDGIVGDETWSKVEALLAANQPLKRSVSKEQKS